LCRCPERRRSPPLAARFAVALALAWGAAAPLRADAVIDVSGSVAATSPRLEVLVALTNRGDRDTGPVEVTGELWGERAQARLGSGIAPGASASLRLSFASVPPRPGRHAVTLLLEHAAEGASDAAGNPPLVSQRAWLSLALGADPGEAVRLAPRPTRLQVNGALEVELESRDGSEATVGVRALTPRGLRSDGAPVRVRVPPRGRVTARLALERAGAPYGSRLAVLVVAETEGGVARTSVAAAVVDVAPEDSWLRRYRGGMVAAGTALLVAAVAAELARRRGAAPRSQA
jgi:hypothetical protein